MIYPGIKLLLRALALSRSARTVVASSCRWKRTIRRSAAGCSASKSLPGYERTYPPHWRDADFLTTLVSSRSLVATPDDG